MAVISTALQLAANGHVERVRPGRHIADVDALDAAFAQRVQLLEAVDVVRDEFTVDADLHRVKPDRVALRERDEHGDLRTGRVQELFLQQVQLGGDAEDVGLDVLHLLVEPLHLLAVHLFGARTRDAETEHQADGDENSDDQRHGMALSHHSPRKRILGKATDRARGGLGFRRSRYRGARAR